MQNHPLYTLISKEYLINLSIEIWDISEVGVAFRNYPFKGAKFINSFVIKGGGNEEILVSFAGTGADHGLQCVGLCS